MVHSGANMLLHYSDGTPWVESRGTTGSWSAAEGGLDYSGSGVRLGLKPQTMLASDALLIMSDGGPVGAADGVVIDESPGLVLGSEAARLSIRFDAPTQVRVRDGVIQCQIQQGLKLRWTFTEDLTEASRLTRRLKNASRDGDTASVLAVSQSLLRDYPYRRDDLAEASRLSREVIQEGRGLLATLSREKADAAFLQSIEDLEMLEARARGYINDYAGTDLAATAEAEATELAQTAEFLRGARADRLAEYRTRLTSALSSTYPLLSSWLQQEASQ